MAKIKDLTGQTFGKLSVIGHDGFNRFGESVWLCECSCGGPFSKTRVLGSNLRRGLSASCRHCVTYTLTPEGYCIGTDSKQRAFYFDADDYEKIISHCWSVGSDGYVRTTLKDSRKKVLMHRFILDARESLEVDHVNRIRHDNRKSNLRIANRSQNACNMSIHKDSASVYKGAYKLKNGYMSSIYHSGKAHYIGYFKTEEEAALAYNKKAIELHGEFANLNNI